MLSGCEGRRVAETPPVWEDARRWRYLSDLKGDVMTIRRRAALLALSATCLVQAQLGRAQECVTWDGFLGDCSAAGACSGRSSPSCRRSQLCCVRLSTPPAAPAASSLPLTFPSQNDNFRFRPRPPQRGASSVTRRRPTLLRPNFACGGLPAPGRARRAVDDVTPKPFVVGGGPEPETGAVGVGVVGTSQPSSPSRPSLNDVLDRLRPLTTSSSSSGSTSSSSGSFGSSSVSRPSGGSSFSSSSSLFTEPTSSPGRPGQRGVSLFGLLFRPPRRRLGRPSRFGQPGRRRRGPQRNFYQPRRGYQRRRGYYVRPKRNHYGWWGRPTGRRGNYYARRRGYSGRPYRGRRGRRSPQSAAEQADFDQLWREYQQRVRAGTAQAGVTRAQLLEAYRAAAQEAAPTPSSGGGGGGWTCGAVLISERHMLTAAHCLLAGTPRVVRLGDRDLSDAGDGAPAEYRVIRVTSHPQYRRPAVYHDLAILHLDRTVTFSRHVRPFCLYDGAESLVNQTGHVAGWGATEFGGGLSDTLMGGNLTIWTRPRCQAVYERIAGSQQRLPRGITEHVLCAGGGDQDACQGDSGGPMTVLTGRGTRLVGIVSAGLGCATPGVPGLYTNVASYIDWIDSVVYGDQT